MFLAHLFFAIQILAFQYGTYAYVHAPTSDCVRDYYKVLGSTNISLRNYQYYHEAMQRSGMNNYEYLEEDHSGKEFDDGLIQVQNRDIEIGWRIVGGEQVSIKLVPYQILYGETCGGVLIAPKWAITAAHCQETHSFIRVGSSSRSKTSPYQICAHFTHPNWKNTNKIHWFDFDYQLLLLEKPIPITPSTIPIAIGQLRDITPGAFITVSGWGISKEKGNKMEEILRRVMVPIVPFDVCRNMPSKVYWNITSRMFCAGYVDVGGKDACRGDSGGPAVINGKLVGVVSFGLDCAIRNQPGVYSNLPVARDWIRSVTGLPL